MKATDVKDEMMRMEEEMGQGGVKGSESDRMGGGETLGAIMVMERGVTEWVR